MNIEEKINLSIVSPTAEIASSEADIVIIPGSEGVFAVMKGHMKLVANTIPGILEITTNGNTKKIFVSYGVMQTDGSDCNILVDNAYAEEDLKLLDIASKIKDLKVEIEQTESERKKTKLTQDLDFLNFIQPLN